MSINPKKPTKGVTCLALTFGTLLSSQGADARDTRPAGPSIAAAVPRYAALCIRQAAGPGPALSDRSGGTQCNQRTPCCVPGARSIAGQATPGPTRGRELDPRPAPVSPGAERKLRGCRPGCQTAAW